MQLRIAERSPGGVGTNTFASQRGSGHISAPSMSQRRTRTTPHGRPRRLSAWEIHPVYAIEVCINTSLSGCPRTDASKWQPLHKWLQALEEEEGDQE